MKMLVMVWALCMAAISHAPAQDFRGFSWGTPISSVQAAEKSPFITKVNNDELTYRDILGGSDCEVIYIFNDNDKLASGLYVFTKKYSNPQLYLQEYNKFKDLLSEKYGKPAIESETWNNSNNSASEKQNYGQAVADGKLTLSTIWNTDRSYIKIILPTNDKHPVLQIHYTTRSLDELENKVELENALKKL
jgi:hypothetical protein